MTNPKAEWLAAIKPFATRKRSDGSEFVSVDPADGPQWLIDAIRNAHCNDWPNDWVFNECKAAWEEYLAALVDGRGEDSDWIHEHADSQADIYTKDRFAWMAEHCLGSLFSEAEERAADMGSPENIAEHAGWIQYCAIALIASTIQTAIDCAWERHSEGDGEDS